MRAILLSALGLVLTWVLQAQAEVRFDSPSQYLGSLKAGVGAVELNYLFTNSGSAPIQVTGINPCDRCTMIASSRGSIEPGSRGFISIRYQLPSAAGRFMENFTVFFNGRLDRPMELMFNGEVLPTEKTPADDFPFLYGPLRMRFHDLNLGRFRNTEKVIREFPVYNAGEVPLKLRSGADKPYLDAYLQPDDLLPGMEGRLSITYNAAGNPGYGPMPDTLPLYSGRTGELVISIPLTMYQEEDFSKLNEAQVDVAPRVAFTNTSHDFGVVRAGDEATHTFEISNKGKRQLVVRNVVSSSPFLQYHLESNKIRFNQKVSLKVYFSAVDKPGPFMEQLTLICNDPSRPEVNVYVQGAVVRQ